MRFNDRLRLGVDALWRQKLRTALTLVGVLIGTTTLVISLSVSVGVQNAIAEQFRKNDRLRQVQVFPQFQPDDESFDGIPPPAIEVRGAMSDEKRERIKRQLARQWRMRQQRYNPKSITPEVVESIAKIPHVASLTPHLNEFGRVQVRDQIISSSILACPMDHSVMQKVITVGKPFTSNQAHEAIIHEFLLYQFGVTDDAAVEAMLGEELSLEVMNDTRSSPMSLLRLLQSDAQKLSLAEMAVLAKAWKKLPDALDSLDMSPEERSLLRGVLDRRDPNREEIKQKNISQKFRIVGVFREVNKEERKQDLFGNGLGDANVVIPLRSGEEFLYQLPRREQEATHRVHVVVDVDDNVQSVVKSIEAMGFQTWSLAEIIEQIQTNVMLITFGLTFISLVALIVASLGITNTLYSSVLERTQEIGIMKAVGARDGDIKSMFLIEGALIGLIGGLGGLFLGWLASLPGDVYATSIMAQQTREAAPETMFKFPWWVVVGIPTFATFVTMLAALYPARRAAKVEPIVALRHE